MVERTAARLYHYRVCRCPLCGETLESPEGKHCRHCQQDVRSAAREAAEARRRGAAKRPQAGGGLTVPEAYAVLGLPLTASPAEIRTGLHRAVAQWHPDRLEGMAQELRAWAAQKTSAINAAYEVIKQISLLGRELAE